jgi:hypothetical protein
MYKKVGRGQAEGGRLRTTARPLKNRATTHLGSSKKSSAQATSTAWKQSLTTATDEVCSWFNMLSSGRYLFKKGGRGWRDTCQFPSWKAGMVSCTHTRDRMSLHYKAGRAGTARSVAGTARSLVRRQVACLREAGRRGCAVPGHE